MALKFIGRDSGYGDEHTSAYFFTVDKEMVIIDCPVSTFQKLKHMDLSDYKNITFLITHTHGDHIGGLGLFVQYAYWTLKKPVIVVAPSIDVDRAIKTLFCIEGVEDSWCTCTTVHTFKREWLGTSILTEHTPQLRGRCFGYQLNVDGTNVVYTGDTCTLKPFLPYLREGSILYVDTSVYYGLVHLKLEDAMDNFLELNKRGVKVYLMHLDDVVAAEKIVADYPNIEVVTID